MISDMDELESVPNWIGDVDAIVQMTALPPCDRLDAAIRDCFKIDEGNFSRDIKAAWRLIDFWQARGWWVFRMRLNQAAEMPPNTWSVTLRSDRERDPKIVWADGYGDAPAEAICRAAINALTTQIRLNERRCSNS